jgi:hypothetical protein
MGLTWKMMTERHKERLVKLVEEKLSHRVVADRMWLSEKQVSRYYKRAKAEQAAREAGAQTA